MINLIVNPTAGKGLATINTKIVTKYLKKENIPYLVYFVEKDNDITDFASTLFKAGEKEFVIIGGDCTIHRFINGISDLSKVKIGIIPSGDNNDFARCIGLKSSPINNIQIILNNHINTFDYIKCNDVKVVNCCSIGKLENKRNENENFRPSLFNINKLKKESPIKVSFFGDEIKEKNVGILELYIANGKYEGHKNVSPLSNTQDGLCNINILTEKEKQNYITEYISLKTGKYIYNQNNTQFWCSSFKLTSSITPIACYCDGEKYEMDQLCVNVIEGGLNIFVEE